MPDVQSRDECGGGDLQWVRDNASEPGPVADPPKCQCHPRQPEVHCPVHGLPDPPASEQPAGRHVAAKARALADYTTRGNYDHHLSQIASAWADIFERPITVREVAEALAAVEILRAH